jgi:hypothetical protein
MHDRVAFDSVREHVDPEDLSAHGGEVWGVIAEYYRLDPKAQQCDRGVLSERLARKMPQHAETFREMLKALRPELGSRNIAGEVLELKRSAAGEALMLEIAGAKSPDDVRPVLEKYTMLNDASGLLAAGGGAMFDTPLSQVIRQVEEPGQRIKLLPKSVNEYIRGGVLPGHCIVIFGRVNVGKSTFAVNMTSGFLRQGKKVVYIENEDLIEDSIVKIGNRLVGCSRDWARDNPEKYEETAMARGFDNLLFPDPAPTSVADVDRLLGDVMPDVCVINQARNLAKGAADVVTKLDQIANQLRAIGKRRRIVMVLVTAATEGEKDRQGNVQEKAILQKADCYSSRTGFPAAADLMFGVGENSSLVERGMRCVSLCKNKLGAKDGETEPVFYPSVNFETGVMK